MKLQPAGPSAYSPSEGRNLALKTVSAPLAFTRETRGPASCLYKDCCALGFENLLLLGHSD